MRATHVSDAAAAAGDHDGFAGEGEVWEGGRDGGVGVIVPFGGEGGEGGLHFGWVRCCC
jgi:hypothetical protein